MLQELRDNSKGVISGILIGLLVIIFAVMGSEGISKFAAANSKAITVNGEGISETDIARGIAQHKQQIISQYGESVPAEYLSDENLRKPVVDRLVSRSLLVQAAKKNGMAANVDSFAKEIGTAPAFQKQGGGFDQVKFKQFLDNQGFTAASFQKAVTDDTVANQLQTGVANSGFITPAEIKTILGLNFQTRDFSYVVIPAEKIEKSVVVEDKDIKAHYDANPQTYTTPEQVAVDYIELSVNDLSKSVSISDDQVKKQFEENTKAFVAKAERHAAHILLEGDAQKKLEEVKGKLAAGEDFAALAKAYSTDAGSKEKGGDLGFSSGDVFPPAFEAALAKLKVGEVSAPVKTDAGISIIKLIEERGSKSPTFEESKASIVDQLKRAEAENQFSAKLEKLKDLAYNAEKLSDVAKELNLIAKNTGLFSKMSGADLTANKSFVDAAFSNEVLEQGNSSDIIQLEPNRVVVIKKTDRKPSQLQSIDSVKDKITQVVRAEKTQQLLTQQASNFVAALNAGKTIAEQAKALNLEVKNATAVSRADKDTERDVLQYAFSLPAPVGNSVAGSTKTAKGDFAVVSLTGVTLATEDKVPAEQRTVVSSQLATIKGAVDFKNYQSQLEEMGKIKRK